MVEYDLPEKDDAPWLNVSYDGFMTHEEMLEKAAQREAENEKLFEIAKQAIEEYKPALEKLSVTERQELAQKSFDELTKYQKIQLALEELDWIVIGGQDGEEFYNSIQFLRKVLESLR